MRPEPAAPKGLRALAEEISRRLQAQEETEVTVRHRDLPGEREG